jgi:organic hydroperoxide reductase OsmC/OhrA
LLDIRAHIVSDPTADSEAPLQIRLSTNERGTELHLAPKPDGRGSATNGGELLCLALATCFCNDIYREAAARGIAIARVEVEVQSTFGGPGEPARSLAYRTRVEGHASADELRALVAHTDRVAEVQNTLRAGFAVRLEAVEVGARRA